MARSYQACLTSASVNTTRCLVDVLISAWSKKKLYRRRIIALQWHLRVPLAYRRNNNVSMFRQSIPFRSTYQHQSESIHLLLGVTLANLRLVICRWKVLSSSLESKASGTSDQPGISSRLQLEMICSCVIDSLGAGHQVPCPSAR